MNVPVALTPEEWSQKGVGTESSSGFQAYFEDDDDDSLIVNGEWVDPASRHALAALALYGQPFGFTQEDVDQLRRLATWQDVSDDGWKVDLDAASLADRIAALLPPRET